MTAVSGSIPNVVGGISQQPPEIRPVNTAEDLLNSLESVVSGKSKRPPMSFVRQLGGVGGSTCAETIFKRADGDRHISFFNGAFHITNLRTGALEPVSYDMGVTGYLTTNDPNRDIGFVAVQDTVFVYNRSVVVRSESVPEDGSRLDPKTLASVWVRQQVLATNYNVYLDGNLIANYVKNDTPMAGTEFVAARLRDEIAAAGKTANVIGSLLSITKDPDERIVATDGYGDQATRYYNESIETFADLPPNEVNGRIVRVSGDATDPGDDHFVVYNDGIWQETFGWNQGERLIPSTMPHVLKYNGNGTWTFKIHEWTGRVCGDAKTNATPSFVGYPINNMFRIKGRLAILADENVIMSETNNYENFYRKTVSQLLDDDRIDIAADGDQRSSMYHAVFNNDDAIFFSKDTQYTLKYNDNILSPNTVSLNPTTHYQCSTRVSPGYIHSNIVFADDDPTSDFTTLREYLVNEVSAVTVGESITGHVPELIPSGAYHMAYSTARNMLILLTEGDRKTIYVYQYHYTNEGKAQSAWTKWTLGGDVNVYGAQFTSHKLYITYERGGVAYLGLVDLENLLTKTFTKTEILLDQKVDHTKCSVSFDGTNSVVTLPYTVPYGSKLFLVDTRKGYVHESSQTLSNRVQFANVNIVGTSFQIGFSYLFRWRLSPVFMRDDKQVVIQDGRLSLSYMKFRVNSTAFFKVKTTTVSGEPYVTNYTGRRHGTLGSNMDQVLLKDDAFQVPCMGVSDRVTVEVTSEAAFPVRFSSIEWKGAWRGRSKRVN